MDGVAPPQTAVRPRTQLAGMTPMRILDRDDLAAKPVVLALGLMPMGPMTIIDGASPLL